VQGPNGAENNRRTTDERNQESRGVVGKQKAGAKIGPSTKEKGARKSGGASRSRMKIGVWAERGEPLPEEKTPKR